MWVTTICARSSGSIPSSVSPSRTAGTDVVGPVSTIAGSSARIRYAEVTPSVAPMRVSIAVIPSATSKVRAMTRAVYGRVGGRC